MKNNSEGGFGHLWLKGDKVKEPCVCVCVCTHVCVHTCVCVPLARDRRGGGSGDIWLLTPEN